MPTPRFAVTFDIDWAPDWAVTLCAEMCRARGVPATFFATHATPLLAELARDGLFEVGIHPNFRDGSSHGDSFAAVLEACLAIAPRARAMRTHDLFCCSSLLALIADRFTQITTDSSIFLPGPGRCQPVTVFHGTPPRPMRRVPFCFADNVAARTPGWRWEAEPVLDGGLMVFDFHPVHIALNLGDPAAYRRLKAALGDRPLQAATRADFAQTDNNGAGARTYLRQLLDRVTPAECATISDFAAVHGETR